MTLWRQFRIKFLNLILQIWAWVWLIVRVIGRILWSAFCIFRLSLRVIIGIILKLFQPLKKYFKKRKIAFFLLILILLCGFIAASAIFPSPNKFEGHLIVQEMSFIYEGNQPNQLFLARIPNISNISVTGSQTLTLSGNFKSESQPTLNRQGFLEVELYGEKSQLAITPSNPETSNELEIRELRLQPHTGVSNLTYNPFGDILSFSLQLDSSQSQLKSPNTLQLYLGTKQLRVTLEGYRLPDLGLEDEPNNPSPLEFTLEADISELNLFLEQQSDLYLDLPNPTQVNTEDRFGKRLNVIEVKFFRLSDPTGLVQDTVPTATIVEGKIRMAERELKIESSQFLIVGKPGIQLLRDIKIIPERGLDVRVAGKSQRVQVGLDPEFPVSSIQAGWLARFFPREAISIVTSFCTAVVVAVMSWLIDDFAKSESDDEVV